ncbi:pentapeptide repeat-containing protein [Glycomyces terrestris]|uniref:Pentapeptide repeat-containing protein n=1 Tax=Glycomyces terrestris TaxID=2493553 RepID=A0A426V0R9_9ACTN|nr:pentapeptide repeat-containing protein [Glycomyces terrestris]RRS00427.1 hypothetical protein EIW28_07620 [Glycomyces terrestris]
MIERFNKKRSRWWRWVAVGVLLVIAAAVAGTWRLIDPLSLDNDADRISGIQAVFTIGFGLGGLATLALFARRQWLQELEHEHAVQVAADARHDAEQRRITEQYIQAVEQLGHDKAPVRLGGLYGLDRLGRDHPGQREKIAEVWCAYLRRRYSPPTDILTWSDPPAADESDLPEPQTPADIEAAEELEVRLTAQRLLTEHLKDPRPIDMRNAAPPDESPDYWHLKEVNLAGATLIDLDFSHCRLPALKISRARIYRHCSFNEAHFDGTAEFIQTRFHGRTRFEQVDFNGSTLFTDARFDDRAEFSEAHFNDFAWFSGARFNSETFFDQASFNHNAMFNGAEFGDFATFSNAHFHLEAMFGRTTFGTSTNFADTLFEGSAWFEQTRFPGDAQWTEARFYHLARFVQAHFDEPATFSKAAFHDLADFSATCFGMGAEFDEVQFHGPADFSDLRFHDDATSPQIQLAGATVLRQIFRETAHIWPEGWEIVPDGATWRLTWTRLRRVREPARHDRRKRFDAFQPFCTRASNPAITYMDDTFVADVWVCPAHGSAVYKHVHVLRLGLPGLGAFAIEDDIHDRHALLIAVVDVFNPLGSDKRGRKTGDEIESVLLNANGGRLIWPRLRRKADTTMGTIATGAFVVRAALLLDAHPKLQSYTVFHPHRGGAVFE